MIRLNKYLSAAGICSRREADRLIESGRVTVDGKRAVPGMHVSENQIVKVGKKTVHTGNERIVLAVNKPVGIICTEDRRTKYRVWYSPRMATISTAPRWTGVSVIPRLMLPYSATGMGNV